MAHGFTKPLKDPSVEGYVVKLEKELSVENWNLTILRFDGIVTIHALLEKGSIQDLRQVEIILIFKLKIGSSGKKFVYGPYVHHVVVFTVITGNHFQMLANILTLNMTIGLKSFYLIYIVIRNYVGNFIMYYPLNIYPISN